MSLEELYIGKVIEADVSKQLICDHCRGTGAKDPDAVTSCPSCGGRGIKIVRQNLGPGFYQQMQTTCDQCGGKGKIIEHHCPVCKGKKVRRGNEQLTITVEKGMADGASIVSIDCGVRDTISLIA